PPDGIERLVGGKPSGRHSIGHRVRHQREPENLAHGVRLGARPSAGCSVNTRRVNDAKTTPIVVHITSCVPSEYNRKSYSTSAGKPSGVSVTSGKMSITTATPSTYAHAPTRVAL